MRGTFRMALFASVFGFGTGSAFAQPPLPPAPPVPPLPSAAAVAEQLKLLAEATGKERLALIDKWADQGPAAALVSGALAKLLADSDEATRIHAAKALGAIGLGAAPVVEALTAAIDPANPRVSAYVIYALGRIGEKAQAAFPKIAEQLTSPDQQVRREAVKAIRGMKLPLETAVPVLVNVLQTAKSPEVVLPALHAMSEVGKPGVPRLVEAMQKQPAARFWVCRILAEIGPDAAEAVPAVIEALGDERADVRQEAVLCLGHIGKPAAPAAKKILALLSDTDAGIRGAAVWALMMVGAPSAEVVAGVKPLLSDSDEMVRLVSAWSIAKLEPENAEQRRASLDLFIAALKQKNPRLRAAAARAIVDLKAGDPAAREALIETLADGDEAVSGIVSHALVEAGEEGVPLLVKGLERPEIRGFAAQTLGQVGPKAKAAVGPLTAALADENPHVRAAILFALGNIAPDDADVAERLIAALSDKSSDIRLAAVHALARNKAAAPIAKPVLEKLLTDPNPAVSAAAQFALDVGKAK